MQARGIRFPPNEAVFGLESDSSMASFNEFYNAMLPPVATRSPTDGANSHTNPPLRGARSGSVTSPKATLSSQHNQPTKRSYLRIEPSVPLGSDSGALGGSGALSFSGSKRLSRGTVDGSLSGVNILGVITRGTSGLARENSAVSSASGGGQVGVHVGAPSGVPG